MLAMGHFYFVWLMVVLMLVVMAIPAQGATMVDGGKTGVRAVLRGAGSKVKAGCGRALTSALNRIVLGSSWDSKHGPVVRNDRGTQGEGEGQPPVEREARGASLVEEAARDIAAAAAAGVSYQGAEDEKRKAMDEEMVVQGMRGASLELVKAETTKGAVLVDAASAAHEVREDIRHTVEEFMRRIGVPRQVCAVDAQRMVSSGDGVTPEGGAVRVSNAHDVGQVTEEAEVPEVTATAVAEAAAGGIIEDECAVAAVVGGALTPSTGSSSSSAVGSSSSSSNSAAGSSGAVIVSDGAGAVAISDSSSSSDVENHASAVIEFTEEAAASPEVGAAAGVAAASGISDVDGAESVLGTAGEGFNDPLRSGAASSGDGGRVAFTAERPAMGGGVVRVRARAGGSSGSSGGGGSSGSSGGSAQEVTLAEWTCCLLATATVYALLQSIITSITKRLRALLCGRQRAAEHCNAPVPGDSPDVEVGEGAISNGACGGGRRLRLCSTSTAGGSSGSDSDSDADAASGGEDSSDAAARGGVCGSSRLASFESSSSSSGGSGGHGSGLPDCGGGGSGGGGGGSLLESVRSRGSVSGSGSGSGGGGGGGSSSSSDSGSGSDSDSSSGSSDGGNGSGGDGDGDGDSSSNSGASDSVVDCFFAPATRQLCGASGGSGDGIPNADAEPVYVPSDAELLLRMLRDGRPVLPFQLRQCIEDLVEERWGLVQENARLQDDLWKGFDRYSADTQELRQQVAARDALLYGWQQHAAQQDASLQRYAVLLTHSNERADELQARAEFVEAQLSTATADLSATLRLLETSEPQLLDANMDLRCAEMAVEALQQQLAAARALAMGATAEQ